jgi:hypothetical protein
MKRMVVGALGLALAVSTSVNVAHAAPKKKPAKTEQREAPQSPEISKAMGDLKWGESRDAVLQRFMDQVKEKYRPLMAKATGAIEEDKLRAKMRDELGRIRASVVEFNGTKSGADASFLKPEFTHHNSESMFAVSDENSKNYYFFINGKLWKWYKAFEAAAFNGKSFDEFAGALQGRYGKSVPREGEAAPGLGKSKWLEWQDSQTRLRAVDNKQFYGFYSVVFESKDTVSHLAQLRTHKADGPVAKNQFVENVTSGIDEEPSTSEQDVLDRITGKNRNRQDAPSGAPAATAGSGSGRGKPTSTASAPAPSPSISEDDDPLKGLL